MMQKSRDWWSNNDEHSDYYVKDDDDDDDDKDDRDDDDEKENDAQPRATFSCHRYQQYHNRQIPLIIRI